MSKSEKIFVPVPQKYMGIVIGTGGRYINEIKRETDTRITSCNGVNSGKESGFTVTGTVIGCEKAQLAIRNRVVSISILYSPIFILMSALRKSYIMVIKLSKFCLKSNT